MKKKNRNPHSKVHDYSKYASKWNGVEIPSDDERYYGIHRDGNRVKIDIKRMKKIGTSGVPTRVLDAASALPRNTTYFLPKRLHRHDYVINQFRDKLAELTTSWREYKTAFGTITSPSDIAEQTRLERLHTGLDDNEDATVAGILSGAKRQTTYNNMVFKHIKKMLVYVQQFEETFVRDQMERLDRAMEISISKAQVDVVTLRRRDEDLNTLFKRLYEDMVAGRISAERFDLLAAEYEAEQKELKVQIAELEDLIENGETKTKDFKQLLVNVRKYTDPQELTSELLNDLVDKIIVHAPDKSSGHRKQKIEIYYNAVGIINLPTVKEDDCIALHGRCKGKKIAV